MAGNTKTKGGKCCSTEHDRLMAELDTCDQLYKIPRSGIGAPVSLRGAAANGRSSACSRRDFLNSVLGTGQVI